MEQFSHDLTLALEETRCGGGSSRWGMRRRTRSTGNLRMYNLFNIIILLTLNLAGERINFDTKNCLKDYFLNKLIVIVLISIYFVNKEVGISFNIRVVDIFFDII